MNTLTEEPLSLRERKKAKTQAAIQLHALRLFKKQGYAKTTIEQIAAAAEVSPSTFFRYFPTKEDVVLYDDLDAPALEVFHAQPAELSPLAAMRNAIREAFGQLTAEEMAEQRERTALLWSVPELRAKMLEQYMGMVRMLAEAVAKRLGRHADDPAVRTLAGATVGVGMAVMLDMIEDPEADLVALMDAGLARLEAGLPL